MAVVAVDERGRLTIPSQLGVKDTKATLIPAGPFLIIVPIPSQPLEASANWLQTNIASKELKALAEKQARSDAVKRARRRKQI